ncbi:hypothetical protein N7495_000218 [Penicillium taxi]|uniref:uncharacterized protein n=1 Tax=Penicillium taxi TaxID=168475 RepID=UPI0025455B20|nr:uncharacterized protein N7495_000218 [Penicillium taxi]KAJ5907536.1 hypothetical protein N7495_000218 [Penicillium taxi]
MEDTTEPSFQPVQSTELDDAPWSPNSSWNFGSLEEEDFKVEDPQALVHLIQCRFCSRPYTNPRRLPCGRTLCQSCLPPIRSRIGITYPAVEGREEGFICYWSEKNYSHNPIEREHCIADCGPDIVLSSVAEVFQEEFMWQTPNENSQDMKNDKGLIVRWRSNSPDTGLTAGSAEVGSQGWLRGLYQAAAIGQLPYTAVEVKYEGGAVEEDSIRFNNLKERVRGELNCHICYSILLHPRTLPCGHTFCSHCVRQIMEHSALCPICRRSMAMMPKFGRVNITLSRLIDHLFFDEVMTRRGASEEAELFTEQKQLPIFVCTVAFPFMPSYFHIFEPRYRQMIEHVVARDGEFGVVMHAQNHPSELGNSVQFMKYGTLVKIDRCDMLPDGRSLVVATGVSRFAILSSDNTLDFIIANTVKVEDFSILEQERQEAFQTLNTTTDTDPTTDPYKDNAKSTQDLIDLCRDFVIRSRRENAQWLNPQVLGPFGDVPDDPVKLLWWIATVLPLSEIVRYQILPLRSVRERSQMVAQWTRAMDAYQFDHPAEENPIYQI